VPSKRGFPRLFAPFRPIAEQLLGGRERPPAAEFQDVWLTAVAIRADRPDSRASSGGQMPRSLRGRSKWPRFSAAFE